MDLAQSAAYTIIAVILVVVALMAAWIGLVALYEKIKETK